MKVLPLGFLYVFMVGYTNWQPKVLFRYPTWYRSAAPVIFWVAPIAVCVIENGNMIMNKIAMHKAYCTISNKVQLLGRASYHIYIVQMLWFGLIIPYMNTDSWRKLIVCVVSMCICSAIGVIYYYANCFLSKRFQIENR